MKKILFTLLVLWAKDIVFAQLPDAFWKTTASFPTTIDGNMSVAIDSSTGYLLIGTHRAGIFKSTDGGTTWKEVFVPEPMSPIYKIELGRNGQVYAAGNSAVYRSEDAGETWEKIEIATTFPVTDLLIADNGFVFASTGASVDVGQHGEFQGDGIFRSKDNGKTWHAVNTGVEGYKSVFHLAKDSKGRIFATLNESYVSGVGGILYSDDYGDWWHSFAKLRFETQPGQSTTALLQEALTFEIDRNDSLYIGYTGSSLPGPTGSSVAYSGNLKNSFEGGVTGKIWNHVKLRSGSYSWFYQPMFSLFFSLDGKEMFSSIANSSTIGGPYYSSTLTRSWTRETNGIVPRVDGYAPCYYVQTSQGRIYAIHQYDHRVYYTDRSLLTSIKNYESKKNASPLLLSPNPTTESVKLEVADEYAGGRIEMTTIDGVVIKERTSFQNGQALDVATLSPGLYLIKLLKEGISPKTEKLVIK